MAATAVAVGFFGFAPWAAVQALTGRWGVTAMILGVLFVAASLWSLAKPLPGAVFGISWGLYVTYLLGYWQLTGRLVSWIRYAHVNRMTQSLDHFAVGALAVIAVIIEGLILFAVPVLSSFAGGYLLVALVAKLRGRPTPWSAEFDQPLSST